MNRLPNIFVSHAKADLDPIPGAGESRVQGIIDGIRRELQIDKPRPRYRLWIDSDRGIVAGDNIPEKIAKAIKQCDIALILLSEAYCCSPNCEKEFRACLKAGKILIILETENIWDGKSGEFDDLLIDCRDRDKDIRYEKFWETRNQDVFLYGDPSPSKAEGENFSKYFSTLRIVYTAIKKQADKVRIAAKTQLTPHSSISSGQYDVFLACPTPDVDSFADRMEIALNDAGHTVLRFDVNQDSVNNQSLESALEDHIARCDVYVQLLGSKHEPFERSNSNLNLVPLQYHFAEKQKKPIFLWPMPGLDPKEHDQIYADFLEKHMLHTNSFEDFTKYVSDYINNEINYRKKVAINRASRAEEYRREVARNPESHAKEKNFKQVRFVTVDAHEDDAKFSKLITEALGKDVIAEPLEDPSKLKDHVSEDDAIVLVYGQTKKGRKRQNAHWRIITKNSRWAQQDLQLAIGDAAPGLPHPMSPTVHVIPVWETIDRNALKDFLSRLGVEKTANYHVE